MLGATTDSGRRPRSSAEVIRQFHETWVGECQPSEGLPFSISVQAALSELGAFAPAVKMSCSRFRPDPEVG